MILFIFNARVQTYLFTLILQYFFTDTYWGDADHYCSLGYEMTALNKPELLMFDFFSL